MAAAAEVATAALVHLPDAAAAASHKDVQSEMDKDGYITQSESIGIAFRRKFVMKI